MLAGIYSFYVGSMIDTLTYGPVTPFKHLSPASFSIGANLSLSPNTTGAPFHSYCLEDAD